MMRRQLVTVRLPGARIAPSSNTCAWSQTRRENKGVKVLRTAANSGGRESKQDHFPGHLHTTVLSSNGQSRAEMPSTLLEVCIYMSVHIRWKRRIRLL